MHHITYTSICNTWFLLVETNGQAERVQSTNTFAKIFCRQITTSKLRWDSAPRKGNEASFLFIFTILPLELTRYVTLFIYIYIYACTFCTHTYVHPASPHKPGLFFSLNHQHKAYKPRDKAKNIQAPPTRVQISSFNTLCCVTIFFLGGWGEGCAVFGQ